ncbi:hypothetical protein [Pseudomonas sp.]|uniref:hypothetical protein n=1 Tax=Pseudomonas sp. TaxID=306 RepID=UPI003BB4C49F
MELKQNPFSFYDFLGYFTPGALFLYSCLAAYQHAQSQSASLESIANSIGLEKAEAYVPFVLLAYTFGHILSFISSVTIERYSLWAMGYPSKYLLGVKGSGYFSFSSNKNLRLAIRLLVFVIILPVSLMDFFIGKFLGLRELYAKPLDAMLANLIKDKIYALMKSKGGLKAPEKHGKASDTDFFHYAYHYAVEHAPNHLPKMQNYVALYGFLRTLTLLSILFFWAMVWHAIEQRTPPLTASATLLLLSMLCYLLFMAFVKFYRRFSLEALMAASVVYQEKT